MELVNSGIKYFHPKPLPESRGRHMSWTKKVQLYITTVFQKENPSPDAIEEWIDAKSEVSGIPVRDIQQCLEQYRSTLDTLVRTNANEQAKTIARALGASRVKVIHRMAEAMDATKVVIRKIPMKGKGDDILIEDTVPDWDTRFKSIDRFYRMYGMEAPQQVEVQHDVGKNIANMHEKELMLEAAKMQQRIFNTMRVLGVDHKELVRIEGEGMADGNVVNITATEEEKVQD